MKRLLLLFGPTPEARGRAMPSLIAAAALGAIAAAYRLLG